MEQLPEQVQVRDCYNSESFSRGVAMIRLMPRRLVRGA